ncbi:MAG: hydroxyacid dehydrogenase, partial [Firmicutes bacterium]|nr:hydroxyacid dehydrogenase [Bacillota bacterium]
MSDTTDIGKTIVVLDDDPTGTQTVHDITVFTTWETEELEKELQDEKGLFYVLTNSRAMSKETTIAVHKEIMKNLIEASKRTGRDFLVISRSDSTLRGHFPIETE